MDFISYQLDFFTGTLGADSAGQGFAGRHMADPHSEYATEHEMYGDEEVHEAWSKASIDVEWESLPPQRKQSYLEEARDITISNLDLNDVEAREKLQNDIREFGGIRTPSIDALAKEIHSKARPQRVEPPAKKPKVAEPVDSDERKMKWRTAALRRKKKREEKDDIFHIDGNPIEGDSDDPGPEIRPKPAKKKKETAKKVRPKKVKEPKKSVRKSAKKEKLLAKKKKKCVNLPKTCPNMARFKKKPAPTPKASPSFVGKDWRAQDEWSLSQDPWGLLSKVEVGVVDLNFPVSSIPESIFHYVDPLPCEARVSFIFENILGDDKILTDQPAADTARERAERTVGRESYRMRLQEVLERKDRLDLSDVLPLDYFVPGLTVQLRGLKNRADLNGRWGTVRGVIAATHRVIVVLDHDTEVNARPTNLLQESEWGKHARTMSLPGAKGKDGQYVYPPVFVENVAGDTVDLQQTAIVEFKETVALACARDIESRVFSEVYEHFRAQKFSKFLVRVDKTQRIDDQIAKCSPKIRTAAAQLDDELKDTLFKKQFGGLDGKHYRFYKHSMRDITKSFEKLIDEIENPSVYTDGVSEEGPSNFSQLTFLEKTVYTWHCFVEKFDRFQVWEMFSEQFRSFSLRDLVRVPGFRHDMTELEKHEARSNFFHLLQEPYGMQLKEMIGIFCACVKHYSKEDSWKKLFVRRILQKEMPDLYSFWYTWADGPWSETDLMDLVFSLDFNLNSKIKDSMLDFVRRHSHELKIEKKKALDELFSDLLHDDTIVEKNAYDMRLKCIKEPVGRISLKASTGIDCSKCGGDTCKWGSGFQSRCGDEPMDEFLLCKKCGFFEKI